MAFLSYLHLTLLLLSIPVSLCQNAARDPYVPRNLTCTNEVRVRNASEGLSTAEESWRTTRLNHVVESLGPYLSNANIEGLDVTQFLARLNASNAPVVGMAISGGGAVSGLGGLGLWQAFDSRYPPAVRAGTGGLTQCITYLSGLSGGGYMSVSTLASNNFTSIERVREFVNFTTDYNVGTTGNSTAYFDELFENAGAKAELDYPVSAVDVLGQMFSQYLNESWRFANYSDIARPNHAFTRGSGPMPILGMAEVVPGQSPNVGGILYPGRNATNSMTLTSYELNPFEFGSWIGGRVQAFMPTRWLGTSMSRGMPRHSEICVQGFDKFAFMQGSTANAFNGWFIGSFYDVSFFAKRSLEAVGLLKRQEQDGSPDIYIPPDEEDNPLVQLVNNTADVFEQSFSESMWANYPNPFLNYSRQMTNVEELHIVDGSETGETIPLRPLIIPERAVDFIIAFDGTTDGEYDWSNGTNLYNTAQSAQQANIPFPTIPNAATFINRNFTLYPTLFGCHATDPRVPLVLYIPNAPWSAYSNYSYMQPSFTDNQLDLVWDNAFNIATMGNGTVDREWPQCLACAVVKKSAARVGLELPEVCSGCFERHCWDLEEDSEPARPRQDYRPLLDPALSYSEFNETWWGS